MDGADDDVWVGALKGWTRDSVSNDGMQLGGHDNIALFDEHKSAADVLAIYNEGHGKSHASDSSCKIWLKADSESTGALTHDQTITNTNDPVNPTTGTYICKVNFKYIIMSKYMYNDKVQTIVRKKIVKEKIKFRGKIINREKVELEWDIPKIITSDIGYQLMFGNKPSMAKNKQDSGVEEVFIKESQNYIMD